MFTDMNARQVSLNTISCANNNMTLLLYLAYLPILLRREFFVSNDVGDDE